MTQDVGRLTILMSALLVVQTTGAAAQNSPAQPTSLASDSVQEIIVTAQRRSENLQIVPIAVATLSSARLEATTIRSTAGLAQITPSLTFSDSNGFLEPRIRGIGNSSAGPGVEDSVATYVDGVYYASAPGTLLSLSNVARVEVLKGPQGTLFGRNATGGLIQVITKDPSQQFGGQADVSYGNYETVRGNFYVTGAITSEVAADISVSAGSQGEGYGKNLDTGADTYKTNRDVAVRSKWIARPDDATTLRVSFDYGNESTSDPSFGVADGTKPLFAPGKVYLPPWDTNGNVNSYLDTQAGGVSLRADREIGPLTLTSITAYRRLGFKTDFDADFTPLSIADEVYRQDDRQISQEMQLTPTSSGRLRWIAGLYYFDLDSRYDPLMIIGGAPGAHSFTISHQDSNTRSLAAFGQATYALTPETNLTAGIRYTDDERTLNGNITAITVAGHGTVTPDTGNKAYDVPTSRLSLDHRFTDQIMGYLSWNRGYKSGGFNAATPAQPAYKPEILDAYELGVKSILFDHHLRLNAAAFYYNYKDIQVNTYLGTLAVIYNGAGAKIYGMDIDLDAAVTDHLKFFAGVDALHDRFSSFPLAAIATVHANGSSTIAPGSATGNRLPFAPDATISVGFDYTVPLSFGSADLVLNELYSTGYYTQSDNVLKQGDYSMLGGSVTWNAPDDDYWVKFWANNMLNSKVLEIGNFTSVAAAISYEPPQTFGGTVGVRF